MAHASEPRAHVFSGIARRPIRINVVQEALIVCGGVLFIGFMILLKTPAATVRATDYFYAYFVVAKLTISGHGGQVYDPVTVGALQRALAAPIRVPHGVIPNVYPPIVPVMFAPLAALGYSTGYVVWLVFNCLLVGLSLLGLMRYAGLTLRGKVLWCLLALCSIPVLAALLQGQLSILLLALFTGTFLAIRAGNEPAAGLLLGLTLVKPQFTAPILLAYFLYRRWTAIAVFTCTALVLFLMPLLILGKSADASFVQTIREAMSWQTNVGGYAPQVNRGFTGFVQLLMPTPLSTIALVLLSIVSLVIIVVAARRGWPLELTFALAVVVALLIGQHVLIHDLTLLLLPGAIVMRTRWYGARHVVPLLVITYVGVFAGFIASARSPLQISAIAMTGLGAWIIANHTYGLRKSEVDMVQRTQLVS